MLYTNINGYLVHAYGNIPESSTDFAVTTCKGRPIFGDYFVDEDNNIRIISELNHSDNKDIIELISTIVIPTNSKRVINMSISDNPLNEITVYYILYSDSTLCVVYQDREPIIISKDVVEYYNTSEGVVNYGEEIITITTKGEIIRYLIDCQEYNVDRTVVKKKENLYFPGTAKSMSGTDFIFLDRNGNLWTRSYESYYQYIFGTKSNSKLSNQELGWRCYNSGLDRSGMKLISTNVKRYSTILLSGGRAYTLGKNDEVTDIANKRLSFIGSIQDITCDNKGYLGVNSDYEIEVVLQDNDVDSNSQILVHDCLHLSMRNYGRSR